MAEKHHASRITLLEVESSFAPASLCDHYISPSFSKELILIRQFSDRWHYKRHHEKLPSIEGDHSFFSEKSLLLIPLLPPSEKHFSKRDCPIPFFFHNSSR